MAVRIALLLTLIAALHAEMVHGQSTVIYEATGRGFWPHRAKFTPDGRFVLMVGAWTGDAAGDQPEFRVWDVNTREFIAEHRFDSHAKIEGLDVAPDGETLLVSMGLPGRRTSYNGHKVWVGDEEVWLWRWEARPSRPRSSRVRSVLTPIHRLMSVQWATPAPGTRLWGRVLFSPDADLVAVFRDEIRPHGDWPEIRHHERIDILEPSGQLQATIVLPDPFSSRNGTRGMAFSPDGRRLATSTLFDNAPPESEHVVRVELRLWDVESGEKLAQRSVIDSTARGDLGTAMGDLGAAVCERVAFSPDGTLIASDGPDCNVQLWDSETLEPLRTLEGPARALHSVAFSPDGTLIAASSVRTAVGGYGEFFLWRSATGELLYAIDAAEQGPEFFEVSFSPNGAWLLTYGPTEPLVGRAVRLWDVNHLLATDGDAD